MDKCEEHRYGKWAILSISHETRSCTECGASQIRLTEVVEPINSRPDYAVVKRRDLEHLERLTEKKIDRVE